MSPDSANLENTRNQVLWHTNFAANEADFGAKLQGGELEGIVGNIGIGGRSKSNKITLWRGLACFSASDRFGATMADSVLSIRTQEEVMFFDTDCGAVVHNMAYLRFIETARTRLAAKLGLDLRQMSETQLFPVVVRTEIDYRRPARLGDQLVIEGEIECFERARFWCRFRVVRPADDCRDGGTCRQSLGAGADAGRASDAFARRMVAATPGSWPQRG